MRGQEILLAATATAPGLRRFRQRAFASSFVEAHSSTLASADPLVWFLLFNFSRNLIRIDELFNDQIGI